MNYFAHGYRFIDRPYFLVGTAIPDALSAMDRKVRVRKRNAEPLVRDCDPAVADVAAGIIQHLDDDDWFHGQRAFVELSMAFAQEIRVVLCEEKGLRAGFLGHIIVELLMDAELISRQPHGAVPYYDALNQVDAELVQTIVGRMSSKPPNRLAEFIGKFIGLRFLEDYANDVRLLMRLNQVMRRVGLETIDERLMKWLPDARRRVSARMSELTPTS